MRQIDVDYEKVGSGTVGGRGRFGANDNSGFTGKPTMTRKTTTIGWKPSCRCIDADITAINFGPGIIYKPIPCTVYDPFGGAMTTCLVAYKLRRYYIATELNQEYIEMGRKRLAAEKDKYGLLE